jgi:transposase
MQAYPLKLRQQALALLAHGHRVAEVARHLGISERSIQRYRVRTQQGRLTASPIPGRTRRISPDVAEQLRQYVYAHPQTTLHTVADWLAAVHGIEVSRTTVSRTMHRLGFRRVPRPGHQ